MFCRHCEASAMRRRGQRRQSGAALVLALLVFGICAALAVAMQAQYQLFLQRGENSFITEQSYAYLRGAEELASLALVMDYETDRARDLYRDELTEIWAQSAQPYPLDDGGMLAGQLEDLQGRFNLNNLSGEANSSEDDDGLQSAARFTPAQQQFVRLLQTFEQPVLSEQEAIVVTESIRDWLDSDNNPRLYGAEDDYYSAQEPAYRAANRSLASVSELRAVANVTPELYLALAPFVTVWPEQGGKLNVHTAPVQVLRSLNADDDLAPLSEAQAQDMAALRADVPFEDVDAFLTQAVYADREVTGLRSLLGESSDWFLLRAWVDVAERETRLYSVLHRNQRHIEALARSSGDL